MSLAIGIVSGILVVLLSLTLLGPAARIRRSLRPFVGRTVHVAMWGAVPDQSAFVIDSVRSLGAGLLILLRRASDGRRILLKVAQPKSASITPVRAAIAHARYVQWDRRKGSAGSKTEPAVTLEFQSGQT